MSGLSIRDLHEAVGGKLSLATLPPLSGSSEPIGRLVTRVEDVRPGDVYWDVAQVRATGAANAEEAFFRGAQGVVASGPHAEPWAGRFSLEIADPCEAMHRFIAVVRQRFAGDVIAVAGHFGKSTTLHLIRTALEQGEPIGVSDGAAIPWDMRLAQLANALTSTESLILVEIGEEPGRSWEDQIADLQPDVLVLPSVPLENTKRVPATDSSTRLRRLVGLLDRLSSDRHVVVNGDEELLRRAADYTTSRTVTVGRSSHCDLIASDVECRDGLVSCRVDGQALSAPLWGRHQIPSMLAAYAVGKIVRHPAARLTQALQQARPLPMRCEVIQTPRFTVINDAGNSRPSTIGPALELLRDIHTQGRRIVVCGELGQEPELSSRACRQVGEAIVSRCGADWLVTWGSQANVIAHAARGAGLPAGRAVCCVDADDGHTRLASLLRDGDVVLVKGQPAQAMQQFVQQLLSQTETVPLKAPPLARGLRESRATLPPG